MASLHILDYVIFVVTIIMSFSIGVFYACRKTNDTPESYLLANRKMHIIPIATSLLVSFISAISMLGNSSEMYYYGSSYLFMVIGWNLGLFLTSISFVPLMHPLKIVSIHEVSGKFLLICSYSIRISCSLKHITSYLSNQS